MPVDLLRSRNVSGIVEQDVFVALDDSDCRVVQMFGQPVGAHEDFRVHVTLGRMPGRRSMRNAICGDVAPCNSS